MYRNIAYSIDVVALVLESCELSGIQSPVT